MAMRLISVHLENVRRYVEPVTLDRLGPGLNLITGPNGAGKSTWVRAIRAVFFAFHRTRQVSDLVPWTAPGASPRITVNFELGGQPYQLSKQFFKGAFARLQTPAEVLEADEAETAVANLLGFQAVKKGEASQIGIPGLLWVEQGASPGFGDAKAGPLVDAAEYLRDALGQSVGEVASSGGDEVLQRLEHDLGQLRIRGRENAPKGALATALKDLAQAQQNQRSLHEQLNDFRERVDRLGRLRSERDRDRAEKPWEVLQAKAHAAQARLDSIRKLQQQMEQLTQDAGHLSARRALVVRELERRQALLASIEERTRVRDEALKAVQDLEQRQILAREQYEKAQVRLERCEHNLEAARRLEQVGALTQREIELQSRHAQLKRSVQSARECQQKIETLSAELSQNAVDPQMLNRLREIEQELALLAERLSAAGTSLRFDLEPNRTVALDQEMLSGQGERLVTREQTLHVEGVGRIIVRPGRTEVEPARQAQKSLQQQHASLLEQAGMESVEQLAQALEHKRKAAALREIEQARLRELAPDGVEQLSLQLAEIQGELNHTHEQITRLQQSVDQSSMPGADRRQQFEAAKVALEAASLEHTQAGEIDRTATESLSTARASLRHAEQELLNALQARQTGSACQAHGDDAAAGPDQDAQDLLALDEQIAGRQAEISRLSQTIETEMPETLALDVERYTASARQALEIARRREIDEASMAAELSQAGAGGLEEDLQRAQADLERCEQRALDLNRRADALAWLVSRIRSRREAVTARLQAPLQQRMDHYLKGLLPGLALTMNADLAPEALQMRQVDRADAGLREPVDEQSFGTREQISLIARLAYADILADAGRATLLMIDDGMLNADGERLERVKRILFDAAQRHQILLFSCHPERWLGLGGTGQPVPGVAQQ